MRNTLLACCTLVAATTITFGQQDSINSLVRRFDHYRDEVLGEKLFIHTDRTFYLTGETMWFKIYCVDAFQHKPLDISKVAYLEILDEDNKAVLQTKVGINEGGGGTFFLPTSLPSGTYSLRAYTQWMRNFSPDFYFNQPITILNPFGKPEFKSSALKPKYDVQLFPEGGNLVEGLNSTIGFRVVDENGKGIEFNGAIVGEKNDTLVRFYPLKFGIGRFNFTPTFQAHKVVIRDFQGKTSIHSFPEVKRDGYVMNVKDTGKNEILVRVTSRGQKQLIYLLAHTRQKGVQAQAHFLEQGQTSFVINKNMLGDGISHLTLFNQNLIPVCERLYFKKPEHSLSLEIHSNQSRYSQRQKINLDLLTQSQTGQQERMEVSVSICKADSLQATNASDVVSYLWLTSELKGAIESPDFYFSHESKSSEAMDNLMLTHGWSRFRWADILSGKTPSFEFIPEYHGPIIHGRVLDIVTGALAKRVTTYLAAPGKNVRLYISRSDDEGKVQYEMQDFIGARKIVAQTNELVDSTYRVEMADPFSESFSSPLVSDFELSEKQKVPITARSFQMQIQNAFYDENPNHIVVPKVDSTAFYGTADEHYLLDDYTRFPTLEEVMREYVPGVLVRKRKGKFHFMTIDHPNRSVFRDDPMVLLDGVPVFDIDKFMQFDPRKIKELDVITQQYLLGPLSFDGLVSYGTYRADLADFQFNAHTLITKYEGLQWTREFFVPHYEAQDPFKGRIPDLRNQLYWSPSTKTDGQGKAAIEFYSSDVPGVYTVIVQGISKDGIPGLGTYSFTVTDRDKL